MSIIGVLAAVAIPAYNKYKVQAQSAAVKDSINKVSRAVSACLTTNAFAACSNTDVNGTIDIPSGISLASTNVAQKACWLVTASSHTACVQFDNNSSAVSSAAKIGAPIGSGCETFAISCGSTGWTGCPTGNGCTQTTGTKTCLAGTIGATGTDTTCGGGSTTSAIVTACASGVCSGGTDI